MEELAPATPRATGRGFEQGLSAEVHRGGPHLRAASLLRWV